MSNTIKLVRHFTPDNTIAYYKNDQQTTCTSPNVSRRTSVCRTCHEIQWLRYRLPLEQIILNVCLSLAMREVGPTTASYDTTSSIASNITGAP